MERDYEALFAELKHRKSHLTALPGERLREDMEAMQRCLYTFGRNQVELSTHVAKFVDSATQAPDVSPDYVYELVRLLHNFLTSVTTYRDALFVVMRHRWPDDGKASAFEVGEYAERLRTVFENGQADFMTKLRNYCTHYNIPVPGLSTTMTWDQHTGIQQANSLRLDRDALLRWNGWNAAAKAFLKAQEQEFEFAPILARYISSTQQFFVWFWRRISELSVDLIAERNAKATEVRLWWEENEPASEWFMTKTGVPQPKVTIRWGRAVKRSERYLHGSHGFRLMTAHSTEGIEVGPTDWWPLPR